MYHFAYGSNMNIYELKKYLDENDFSIIGDGYIENYIFCYRKFLTRRLSGKANIEERKNSKVYGLIVKIHNNVGKLDKKEGCDLGLYYKKGMRVRHCDTNKVYKCFSYVMSEEKRGDCENPSKLYRKKIVSGARIINLPESYIKNRIMKVY